ncbi:MAG: DNA primase [Deltaproteobacteria bacterium]|nr:MAG: DNA primase [Deltaproteobacteria bacterium]
MTSYSFPPEFVADLRARVDIVSLVSDYVALTKAGVNYKGLCPFHGEKTPSFTVHEGKGIFHCFGCGVGGDAIGFLKRIENLSYPETLIRLATRTGIDISPYERRRGSLKEQEKARSERENLSNAAACAQNFFARLLQDNLNGKVGAYLKKRGITPAAAQKFGLGFAPDAWSALKDEFQRRQIPESVAVAAGLLVRKEGTNRTYDRFRDRLIFPIRDVSGTVIGFGGRSLGDGEPKYLNSPESVIFNKRRLLYDLHHARPAIGKIGSAFLVEGYMDALSLYLRGIDNVVATLGTALSEENVAAVKRYTRKVAVFFDNDKAGQAAAFRSLPLFMAVGIMPDIVLLPEGIKDPDQLAAGLDDAGLQAALTRQRPLCDLFLQEKGASLAAYSDRLQFLRQVIEMIIRLPDEPLRGMALRATAESLHLAEEIVLDEYRRLRQNPRFRNERNGQNETSGTASSGVAGAAGRSQVASPDEIVLATFLLYQDLLEEFGDDYQALVENRDCARLFHEFKQWCASGNCDLLQHLAGNGEDDTLASLYARLMHLPAPAEDLAVARKVVSDCFMSLRKRQGNAVGRDLDLALTTCQDEEQMFALLRQKMELKKRLMQE